MNCTYYTIAQCNVRVCNLSTIISKTEKTITIIHDRIILKELRIIIMTIPHCMISQIIKGMNTKTRNCIIYFKPRTVRRTITKHIGKTTCVPILSNSEFISLKSNTFSFRIRIKKRISRRINNLSAKNSFTEFQSRYIIEITKTRRVSNSKRCMNIICHIVKLIPELIKVKNWNKKPINMMTKTNKSSSLESLSTNKSRTVNANLFTRISKISKNRQKHTYRRGKCTATA